MKLLLLIDDYLPESTRVAAKMFHELAVELQRNGHTVTVITPGTEVKGVQEIALDGVNILKFQSANVKDSSKIKRAVNETLLSLTAWRRLKPILMQQKFDGIIYYSPSIFWGGLVSKLKSLNGCPSYLVLRDLFPQWAIDGGMIRKGSLIEKYFRYFETKSYRAASSIGVMSEENLRIFRQMRAQERHDGFDLEILRNWADPDIDRNGIAKKFRERLGLNDKVIFLYGGNIGSAQDMPNLMKLARSMKDEESAHFLFVGQGDQVDLIKQLADKWALRNFTLLPSISQNDFKILLSEVDVGLFSLAAEHTTHNFPGKLLGYMVYSIPILGSVNSGNDLRDIVVQNGAGFISTTGNDSELLESAMRLLQDEKLRRKMGECGKQLLEKEFSVRSAATKITGNLLKRAN